MTLKRLVTINLAAVIVSIFSNTSVADAATLRSVKVFAQGTDPKVKGTGPDSITATEDSIWVSYTNGADSTGAGGNSTIVQYDFGGKVLHTFSVAGYVDGLKVDPRTGLIWALQNQDGNSTLTLIDPEEGITANSPISYKVTSSSQGYDDVVFLGNRVFLSYTNPVASSDPTIQMLVKRPNSQGSSPLVVTTILTQGATGTDLATGKKNQPTTQTDPDSLKLTPSGDLQLSSGADGQLIFVRHPGTNDQAVAFLTLVDQAGGPETGLDDAVFATARRGVFYLADTSNNRILAITVDDLDGELFASVSGGTVKAFVIVNTKTGVVTPFVETVDGKAVTAPHGIAFVPRSSDDEGGDR